MRNWQAAVRTWEGNGISPQGVTPQARVGRSTSSPLPPLPTPSPFELAKNRARVLALDAKDIMLERAIMDAHTEAELQAVMGGVS